MTRVMMVVPQYPYPVVGGLERQAHELSRALRARGVDVQALSGRVLPGQPSLENVEGVPVHRFAWTRRRWLRVLRTPFDLFIRLYRLRSSYDVIHLHQHSWIGLYAILVARVLRKPILTKLPNVGIQGIPAIQSARLGALKLKILFSSDALVAMSEESLGELRGAGYPLERVLAVPNGIDLGLVSRRAGTAEQSPTDDARSHDAPGQVCKVVYVGRVGDQKRIDLLIEQWPAVLRQCQGAAILEIWGSGPKEAELKRRCQELGLTGSVVWRGHVDEVRSSLPTMDVFVLPSTAEGNSNAILEAMAAGLPVVSNPVGGTAMMLGPAGAPLLFELDDTSLTRILVGLIRDPVRRRETGSLMRSRVEQHFGMEHIAGVYEAAYKLLAAGKAKRMASLSQPVVTGQA